MKKYKILKSEEYSLGEYSLVSIREQDIMLIRKWRNEQMSILRQKRPLSEEDQRKYFEQHIWPSFEQEKPDQILFSFLHKSICIGYGGLVHISWEDRKGELSFLLDNLLVSYDESYDIHFSTFLYLIKQIAFDELALNRIFTETFDIRPTHISILEKNGFVLEGRLRSHVCINGLYIDSLIHGTLKGEKK